MKDASKVARGGRIPALLLMAASLLACGGDSTTESNGDGPYTVGGSITGINSGGTLSISNRIGNSVDHQKNRMIFRTDTTYIFSRRVERGETFQVAVEGSPENQRCTVSNGTGLVSANVSNVDIHCVTPPRYSVGGSVTGLSSPLILKINGGETVTVASDSSYTFPSRLMSGTAYQVAVHNEPANQDCAITNASGTLGGNVTNISVSCISDNWVHPAHLAVNISPDGEDAINPQIAMDGFGNAIAVWQQFDGTFEPFPSGLPISQIYMSDYNLTTPGAWTHPTGLTDHISVAGESAVNPQVAMGRNGTFNDAVIVWAQDVGLAVPGEPLLFIPQLFMSERRSGVWSHPVDLTPASYINPAGSFIFEDPRVAMDDLGNTIIVWRQHEDLASTINIDAPQLYISEYRSGVWTHPADRTVTFSLSGRPVRFAPDVAMANNGDAVVVWRQHSGTSQGAFLPHRREYRLGAWSPVPDAFFSAGDTITPFQSGNLSGIKVAMDNSGNAIIVWDQLVQEPQPHPFFPGSAPVGITHIFKSEYRGATWSDPVDQFDNISPAGLSVQNPNVVMNDSDEAIITWAQEEDGSRKQRIFKSEYRMNAWTHPASLADNISLGGAGIANHDVALANNGDAIIVWRQFDDFKFSAYKSEYRVSVAEWRHPKGVADAISSEISVPTDCDARAVNCLPATVETGPVVAMDNSAAPGDALILWSQSDSEDEAGPVSTQIFMSEWR